MCAVVRGARHERARLRDLPHVKQRRPIHPQDAPEHILRDRYLRHHPFAPRLDRVHLRVLLVRIDIARQDKARSIRMVGLDPLACRQRRFAYHVLPGRVAGRVVEAQVEQPPDDVLPYLY